VSFIILWNVARALHMPKGKVTHSRHLNQQLKDAMEAGLIRPNHSEFGSPIQ
jgi:hypothetical protein